MFTFVDYIPEWPEAEPIIKLSYDKQNDWDDDLFSLLRFMFKVDTFPCFVFVYIGVQTLNRSQQCTPHLS